MTRGLPILAGLGLLWSSAAQAQETALSGYSAPKDQLDPDQLTWPAKRFQGSSFTFEQSTTTDVVFPGSTLSPVPSYEWWFSLRPRYYLLPNLSLRARFDLTVEWLNTLSTGSEREPIFGNVWTDIAYNPPEFAGILPTVALRAVWGTSIAAMNAGDVVDVGPALSLVRDFHAGRFGEVELSLASYALYHLVTSNTGGTQTSYACSTTEFDPIDCDQNTGLANEQITWATFFGVRYNPIPRLSIGVSYTAVDEWAYGNTEGTFVTQTGSPLNLTPSPTDTRQSQTGWFLASIDYEVRRWLSFGIGYYCRRPVFDPDSQYGDPFFEPGNTRLFFTTTFNLDWAYQVVARR